MREKSSARATSGASIRAEINEQTLGASICLNSELVCLFFLCFERRKKFFSFFFLVIQFLLFYWLIQNSAVYSTFSPFTVIYCSLFVCRSFWSFLRKTSKKRKPRRRRRSAGSFMQEQHLTACCRAPNWISMKRREELLCLF